MRLYYGIVKGTNNCDRLKSVILGASSVGDAGENRVGAVAVARTTEQTADDPVTRCLELYGSGSRRWDVASSRSKVNFVFTSMQSSADYKKCRLYGGGS